MMEEKKGYVPPRYVPLGQSEVEVEVLKGSHEHPAERPVGEARAEWSSGICACFDDMQSCCVGLLCPCYLFGKNAEVLGSGTFMGSCVTHFLSWALLNSLCCLCTDGTGGLLGLPGCFIACYACGYRQALRSKYNLPEAPCGDFVTHFFCHLCAVCQEYREITERSGNSGQIDLSSAVVTAPHTQVMQSASIA